MNKKKLTFSQTLYNAVAKNYKNFLVGRSLYLKSIENLIGNEINASEVTVSNYIDLGAGTGERSKKISHYIKAKKTWLVDNSEGMIGEIHNFDKVKIIKSDISSRALPSEIKINAELITCLWNVLGHVETEEQRLTVLKNAEKLLSPNGIFVFDVNNRYNAVNYGYIRSIKNIFMDIVRPSTKNGNINFDMEVDKKKIPAKVHLFSKKEVNNLIAKANLDIKQVLYINYDTGNTESNQFAGQLLYFCKKRS